MNLSETSYLSLSSLLMKGPTASSAEAIQKGAQNAKELEDVAADFEAMLLSLLLQQMRKTIPKSGLLGEEAGCEVYQELMDQALAEEISEGRGLGLREMLIRSLSSR